MKFLRYIKDNKMTVIMIIFFFIGLLLLLYPTISNHINIKIQSKAITSYEKILEENNIDYDSYFEEIENYNKELMKLTYPLVSYRKLGDVPQIIDSNDYNMIGYIKIEKIKVELPIYYGTNDKVLNTATGLVEGTSFPIGGAGTHAVISAHRGLPSSLLFTNLDKLEIGDIFVIKILNKTLTYEVDQILIVDPDEVDALGIKQNQDYVTLMTCTPYGINTHRLLVRGHRIENLEEKKYVSTSAFKIDKFIVIPIACIPILFIWLLSIFLRPVKNNKKIYENYIYPNGRKQF